MRWPSGPGHGGASRPGSSRFSLTQNTRRPSPPSAGAIIEGPPVARRRLTESYLKRSLASVRVKERTLMTRARRIAVWLLLLAAGFGATAHAQYFGQNKVQYQSFDFQILHTEHFDIYFYPEEAEAASIVARMAERWQSRLSRFFSHELRGRQPVILYAVGSHFRQTNAIEGLIGEGTGGVTEPLKRRVVLPMSGSLADTDHVLGHELVHAFQFDLTGTEVQDGSGQTAGI